MTDQMGRVDEGGDHGLAKIVVQIHRVLLVLSGRLFDHIGIYLGKEIMP